MDTQVTTQAAPCPRCGGSETKTYAYQDPDHGFVQCQGCGQNGPDGKSAHDAITQWNAWAQHDALKAEVERLTDDLAWERMRVTLLQGREQQAIAQSEDVQRHWLAPIEAEGLKAELARLRGENERQAGVIARMRTTMSDFADVEFWQLSTHYDMGACENGCKQWTWKGEGSPIVYARRAMDGE
jgi:hypothetical protein